MILKIGFICHLLPQGELDLILFVFLNKSIITFFDVAIRVSVTKGSFANEHLVYDNSKAVVVKLQAITFLLVNFRRNGMRSSTNSKSSPILSDLFAEPKINHADSSININDEITGFDISINKSFLMEFFEDEAYLSCYQLGH